MNDLKKYIRFLIENVDKKEECVDQTITEFEELIHDAIVEGFFTAIGNRQATEEETKILHNFLLSRNLFP